jgi:hypothetical protein
LAELGVVGLVVACAVPFAALGPGYVLDDWFSLANARFSGGWAAAGSDQWFARPGAGVSYAVVFGAIGLHPLAAFALLTACNALAAVLIYRLAAKLWTSGVAFAIAAVWVLLPNHSALKYWPSATNIVIALVLTLGAWLLVAKERPTAASDIGVGALIAMSGLFYEATLPAAVVGTWFVANQIGRPTRRPLVAATTGAGAAGVWVVAFWHPAKHLHPTVNLSLVVPAHFGWAVFPDGAASMFIATAVTAAMVVIAARAVRPRDRRTTSRAERQALQGAAVIALGVLPFVRYLYEPLGAGDRVNVISSLGASMVWVALGRLAWSRLPKFAVVVAAVLVVAGFAVTDYRSASAWSGAGHEAAYVVRALHAARPCDQRVVVRASTPRRNVAAFLDGSNIRGAAAIACGNARQDAVLVARDECGQQPQSARPICSVKRVTISPSP